GGLALRRGEDPGRACIELDRAALAGLELPELELWRLGAAFRRAATAASVAPDVLAGVQTLRRRFDPGREGDELELACLIALGRGQEALEKLAVLQPVPPVLAWQVKLIFVDHALARFAPADALTALGSTA